MAITPGTRLGPYEILFAIGAGGMGEVYKARDTRLDRIVAIKVLPTHLADRSELRERFEREAKTIASLNHPHICTLYDIGHQDGTDFLVMEYLEGETLVQRLLKGPLPIEQVLQYAIEIADALDKAHRKGITHRDLKPGNIMITKSGTKLLDFGLAKWKQEATPGASLSQLPTVEKIDLTAEGTVLGTIAYMAPEQVEGKTGEIDARTDIFAFGAVVYEMATDKKAFEGKTSASVMAKIMEVDPPPMSSLQPITPPVLDRIVKRCLAKDPENRWQTARDIELELKSIAEGGSQVSALSAAPVKGFRAIVRRPLVIGLGALLLGAAIASLVTWYLKPAPARPVTRAVIDLPAGEQLAGLPSLAVAVSRDGKQLAYVAAAPGGIQQLYLRAMNSLEARSLPDTQGATDPFFSPDGQWLGFWADGRVKKISVNGGAAVTLCDAGSLYGATWSSQGTIVFGPGTSPLLEVPDTGGTPQPLMPALNAGETGHVSPEFLPGGKAVLFTVGPAPYRIAVYSLETGKRRDLIQGGNSPQYSSSGYLVYAQTDGTLMAVPFDAQRLEVTGAAVTVVEGVMQSAAASATGSPTTQYSLSSTGSLVYVAGSAEALQRQLVWVTRSGVAQPLPAPAHAYDNPRISPDGKRIAVEIGPQIWLYDLARETLTRLTFEASLNQNPVWTPDGKRITFYSDKEGPINIFWQRADGSGGLERLTSSQGAQVPISWSPDGRHLAFHVVNPHTLRDLWVLSLADRQAKPFLQTQFNEGAPEFSPNGHRIAYVSNESGRAEIYVQPYPGPGAKWQISTSGGNGPLWNPKSEELFYVSGDKMMAVPVETQNSFSAGRPRVLFEGHYAEKAYPQIGADYDVSPDGQQFLMMKPVEQPTSSTHINLVLNWTEELKRLVSAGTK
jgi:Tol biopolymer transport system component/predicted Ser/Thr protein kinase